MSSAPAKTGLNFLLRALKPCLPGPRTGSGLGEFSQTCRAVEGEREGRRKGDNSRSLPRGRAASSRTQRTWPGMLRVPGAAALPAPLRAGPGRAVLPGGSGPGMSLREERAGTGQGAAGTAGKGRLPGDRPGVPSRQGPPPGPSQPRATPERRSEVRALYLSFEK